MDRRSALVLAFIFGGLFLSLFGFLFLAYLALKSDTGDAISFGERVGVVEVKGVIMDSKDVLKALKTFGDDEDVKAVVLRVESPGGAVGPSQEIYAAVRSLVKKKHVVASLGSVAASGGYYAACAAEKIIANPGTFTGSIGVILSVPNVGGLLDAARVKMNVVKSGKLKDAGSAFREMTAEERAYLEDLIRDIHGQFVRAVAEGRQLKVEEVEPLADGRALTGLQAKTKGLVDELGGFADAVKLAGNLAGLGDDPKLVYPPEKKGAVLEGLFEGGGRALVRALRQEAAPAILGPAYLAPFAGPGAW